MLWRAIEYAFLCAAGLVGARIVYRLWVGADVGDALAELEHAEEDADAAGIQNETRQVKRYTDILGEDTQHDGSGTS